MQHEYARKRTYHAAPKTLSPIASPMPVAAHAYGLDSSRNRPTLNASPEPARHVHFWILKIEGMRQTSEKDIK